MVNNIGSSSGSQSTYYSQANDASSNRSNSGSQRRTRSSNGQFGSLAARQDTLSEFGSVASGGPLDYSDYAGNPYYNQSEYSQWAGSVRTPSTSSAESFASADNRSFDNRSTASSISSIASSHLPPSTASSIASSHLPLSSHSGSSSQKSRRSRSDVSVALSEAGSRHSSQGHLPTRFSDRGSIASSLNDSERAAIATAMDGGRFRGFPLGPTGSGTSTLHSISQALSEAGSSVSSLHTISDNPSKSGSSVSSLHTISDNPSKSGSSVSSLHSISDNLSEAGSRSSSVERAELVERLNRVRDDINWSSVPANLPSMTWQPDVEMSVSDFTPSTAVTEAPPPTRRPPPPPSRLRTVRFADSSTASVAPSYQPSVAPSRRGPSIYGQQPPLKRFFNSLNPRR